MNLKNLRNRINLIDEKIVRLLNERAEISGDIGEIKARNKIGIYSPAREKEVLKRIKELNKGPMTIEALEAVYREIMSSSLALEKISHIAHLGTIGSFSYIAAKQQFGSMVDYVSCSSIAEVFDKVEHGECDYGVVPVENSIEGAVTHTVDLLVDSELKVCAQRLLKVSHNLLANGDIKKIKKVYSNPNVFGQCRNWLLANLPPSQAKEIWVASTTDAVQRVLRERNAAAIASIEAAKIYNIRVLKRNIQDVAHNMTRFLIISAHDVPPTGKDRTSIIFSIKDSVGALHAMLTPFYKNKINLTKIESRPSKKKAWDYYFFVDFEGHRLDKNVTNALGQLEGMCKYLKVVGSYPV
ncbi:MAG TPA: prephenate dehydratase [Candidatus Omnitrophota bacterium]|nr:prephenate dehydratase [Candidatus Omnitrophota bacterium]